MRYMEERQQLIDTMLEVKRNQLVVLSGGNISMRMPCGNFLVTPSAMAYETMTPEDIVLIDEQGETVEGCRRATSDKTALLYIFRHMPDVNVIIHTHQPYATAVGLVCDKLPATLTTLIDELHADVHVAPFTRSSDEGMGILTVDHIGDALAVILKHHGVIAIGKDIDQALSACVSLEESSRCYLAALATGRPVPELTPEQIAEESEERGYYGQP